MSEEHVMTVLVYNFEKFLVICKYCEIIIVSCFNQTFHLKISIDFMGILRNNGETPCTLYPVVQHR